MRDQEKQHPKPKKRRNQGHEKAPQARLSRLSMVLLVGEPVGKA